MTRPDITAIEERLAKATPGPWRIDWDGRQKADGRWIGWACGPTHEIPPAEGDCSAYDAAHGKRLADAALIAHAPTDLAACVAYIRELEASLDRSHAEADRLSEWLRIIDGGDHPCNDAATLRRWAYEAGTLGRKVAP